MTERAHHHLHSSWRQTLIEAASLKCAHKAESAVILTQHYCVLLDHSTRLEWALLTAWTISPRHKKSAKHPVCPGNEESTVLYAYHFTYCVLPTRVTLSSVKHLNFQVQQSQYCAQVCQWHFHKEVQPQHVPVQRLQWNHPRGKYLQQGLHYAYSMWGNCTDWETRHIVEVTAVGRQTKNAALGSPIPRIASSKSPSPSRTTTAEPASVPTRPGPRPGTASASRTRPGSRAASHK